MKTCKTCKEIKENREIFTGQAKNIINDPELKVVFTSEDLAFMNKELGRQAGAVFARILRAFKKMDFKEVQRVLTGGKSK